MTMLWLCQSLPGAESSYKAYLLNTGMTLGYSAAQSGDVATQPFCILPEFMCVCNIAVHRILSAASNCNSHKLWSHQFQRFMHMTAKV